MATEVRRGAECFIYFAIPAFIFTGPDGYPFPKGAEVSFKKAFEDYQKELYGG